MQHRMIEALREIGVRAFGMTPLRAEHLAPPFRAHDTTRLDEVIGQQAGEDE